MSKVNYRFCPEPKRILKPTDSQVWYVQTMEHEGDWASRTDWPSRIL